MMFAASRTVVSFPELGWGPWNINRLLVEDLFGFLNIAWYGVIICVGMLLACTVILRNAVKKEGFELDSFLDYFIFCIPIGVIGARVMYVLARLDAYDSFREMIAIWEGGIAIYGAVIAGGITALVLAKIKKQSVLKVFDAMVPGLLLAQAIGRWGNFVNGEAYGETMTKVLPWGMVVNGVGPVHPTFLYESLITLTGFLLAMFLIYPKKKWNGQVFCFYLVWYGIGRVLVEGLRTDSLMIGPFRLAQCIGLLSALGGVALFVLLFRKHLDGASATQAEAVTLSENGEEPSEPAKEEKNEPACAEMKPVEETACEEAETVEEPISPESDIAEEKKDEKKENEDGTDH